jgi:FkbM family methyltransferase
VRANSTRMLGLSGTAMAALSSLLRRIARLPGLRLIRQQAWPSRMADAVFHAQLVEQPVRFMFGELRNKRLVGRYRPRQSRVDVFLRHRTSDRYILNEIFGLGLYDPPAGATAALAELGRPPIGLDLGAHIGLFGALFFSRFPEGELDAFEPDPENAALLRRCISANRLAHRWRVIEACAATADGTALLLADRFAESRITRDAPDAIEVTARDAFPFLAAADLVKIDIEGSEWAILDDSRLAEIAARVVVLEYHPQGCSGADPRQSVHAALTRLGFFVEDIGVPHAPPGVGMSWAWRSAPRE